MAFPHDGKKFKKGESGNALGRPSYKTLEEELRDMAYKIAKAKNAKGEEIPVQIDGKPATYHEVILQKMIYQSAQGDDRARKEYITRIFGKPKETIELANRDGEAFRTENLIADDKEIIKRYLESQGSKTTKE
jgi:hypothetical protein